MSQSVATLDQFKQEFDLALPQIKGLLPTHVKEDKFKALVVGVITANPKLLETDRGSLFTACRNAAEIGLSLNPALGEADILSQWDGRLKRTVARFQPRYGGLMKLARQSGQMRTIYAHVVREGDFFDYELGLDKYLKHKPGDKTDGALTHVYCVWVLKDGTKDFDVMPKAQVEVIKARSPAKNQQGQVVGPWVTDTEEMWRKTVVRRASKYWPRSPEMERAAAALNDLDVGVGAEMVDAVDVTDWAPAPGTEDLAPSAEPEAPAAKAAANVDAVAERIGAKPASSAAPPVAPAPTPPTKIGTKPRVLSVPQKDGTPDWPAYAATVQDKLGDAEDAGKFWAAQAVVLANLKTARPDLYDALDSFRNTL